ncbi:hypothetical protein [Methyloprofundus sp.]|uniref:FG-GAP repeat protein n=1 Tax=Methyloprofundus sp. TaxID=2020875 RepID=UPI003D0E70E6
MQLPFQHEVQLSTPATLADKKLGTALAVSGATAAVAAFPDTSSASGSVYIYAAGESWRLTTELNSQPSTDGFGQHIVLVNDSLFVSASKDDEGGVDSGAVYVFERNPITAIQPWRQLAKIKAPDMAAESGFGDAIAFYDDFLYIGAARHGQGKVYIYSRDAESKQWRFMESIEPDDPQALRFGAAIALDKETLIIGAPLTDANDVVVPESKRRPKTSRQRQARFAISKGDTVDPGIESGAIFVYENKAGFWQPTARIGASNRESGDNLGEVIAVEGNTIAASVKHKDVFDDLRGGAVYIYIKERGAWHEDTALFPQVHNVGANFGNSFAMLDKHILVGANKIHANGFNSGMAYVYTQDNNNTWQVPYLQANAEIKSHDQFGLSVALGQEYMLAASKNAVFVFQNTPVQYYPAVFYPESNSVQLNEIAVADSGVFSVTFHSAQQESDFVLTLTESHLRADMQDSDTHYINNTQLLHIPRLAIPKNNGEDDFFSVVLEQIQTPTMIQFRVVSFSPL